MRLRLDAPVPNLVFNMARMGRMALNEAFHYIFAHFYSYISAEKKICFNTSLIIWQYTNVVLLEG
jgi:hypothetical protein